MTSIFQVINWRRHALFSILIVPIFAFVGPFGTIADMTYVQRLEYWGVAIVGCGIFFSVLSTFTLNAPILAKYSTYWRVTLGVCLAAFPSSILVYLLQTEMRERPVDVSKFPRLWFMVFGVGLFIRFVSFFVHFSNNLPKNRVEKKQLTDMHMDTDAGVLAFLGRLPKDLGISLVSLSMQDHYLQVVTARGSAMLYMSFADALEELKNYPGFRIHRSHWVVQSQIISLAREGRSQVVKLTDGRTLPVSNTYKASVADL